MAAYVIAEIELTDPSAYEDYKKVVPATIEAYGGKYLTRGGAAENLEGKWIPKRIVILEFDSMERAKQWWHSEEYKAPKRLRQSASYTNMIVVEGA